MSQLESNFVGGARSDEVYTNIAGQRCDPLAGLMAGVRAKKAFQPCADLLAAHPLPNTVPQANSGRSHGITDPGHSHSFTDPGHSHSFTDPGHSHSFTDPSHSHSFTDPSHSHSFTDPSHSITPQMSALEENRYKALMALEAHRHHEFETYQRNKARNHAVMYGEGVYSSDGSFTPRDDLQKERIAAAVASLSLKTYSNCAPPASGVVDFGVEVVQGLRGPVMHWHDARVPQPSLTDGLVEQLAERGLHVTKITNSISLNGRRVEIICEVGQPVSVLPKDAQEDLVADLRRKVDNLVCEKVGLLCRMIAQDKELAEREADIKRMEVQNHRLANLQGALAILAKSPQPPAPTPELTDIIAVKWPSADPFAKRKDKLVSWAGED